MTGSDYWEGAAEDYDERSMRHWRAEDPLRDFVAVRLSPGSSVLDIGAGTGSWSIFLARRCARVTALDSSEAMRAVMRRKVEAAGIGNIAIAAGSWPEVEIEPHALCFCAHAMYGTNDLLAFYRRMDELATEGCILIVRRARLDESLVALGKLGIEPSRLDGDDREAERSACLLDWQARARRELP